jgi:glycosyltransferase involved in cell wall biosynthesis
MSRRAAAYRADVVIPCYQEQEALPISIPRILGYFSDLVADPGNGLSAARLILVDDGSEDATWEIIEGFARAHANVEGLQLSRNFGHQAAMLAGLSHADADVVVTMDADLQDDIEAIAAMIAAFEGGAHLALGVRNDRSSDSLHKHGAANAYYRLLAMLGVEVVPNHADFRLISRTALAALLQHQEVNLFLRGLIPTLGFSVTLVPYKRQPRNAGETKYTLRKMARLALDGITSFSVAPLRIIAVIGGLIFIGTMVVSAFFLWAWFNLTDSIVPGWASTVLPMLFLGGMQLLSIGVLGEYVGKIYLETKRRPRFIVQDMIGKGLESAEASKNQMPPIR